MSYDLCFWREEHDLGMPPGDVADLLQDDTPVAGVATFPRSEVRQRFRDAFPDINDGDVSLDWRNDDSYFQVGFNHADERNVNCIIVACGYQLLQSPEMMNRIVDVGNSLGCALFDLQTGERDEQPEGQPMGAG